MSKGPLSIIDTNLSRAWATAFLELIKSGSPEVIPLTVTLRNFTDMPNEIAPIRQALDHALVVHRQKSCATVANTIFPSSLWHPAHDRNELYERYLRILPSLKRADKQNRNGLYFERLIAFDKEQQFNQLEHIISTFKKGNRRRSALQAAIFNPLADHTDQIRRGFPCLQQVSFVPHGDGKRELAVTGVYTTQHLFDRAYGNYIGLCRLGNFMAHEMGLCLTRMTCITTIAKLGNGKRNSLKELADIITNNLSPENGEAISVQHNAGGKDVITRKTVCV